MSRCQCREFSPKLLYWTLLHEALHSALTRNGAEISEARQHAILRLV